MSSWLSFPTVVNEKAARTVAAGVVVLTVAALVTGSPVLIAVLALGFAARVAAGPRFSPLGQLATRVVAPRLGEPRPVAGAPKRFAQGVGLAVTASALVLSLVPGAAAGATALLSVLVGFALLESALGFCAGCWAYGHLIRLGVIRDDACVACADIRLRGA